MFKGARIRPTGVQNYTNISVWDTIRFLQSDFDTGGFWSVSQPNRLTIPAGVTKVRLRAAVAVSTSDLISPVNLFSFKKNGSENYFSGSSRDVVPVGGYPNPGTVYETGVIAVEEGDYFEAIFSVDASFSLSDAWTWFEVEVMEEIGADAYRTQDLLDVSNDIPSSGEVLVWDASLGKYKPGVPVVDAPIQPGSGRAFMGALVRRTADLTGVAPPIFPIIWQSGVYDTDSFWSASQPSRLTIPAGVLKVRLTAYLKPVGSDWSGAVLCQVYKNGTASYLGEASLGWTAGYGDAGITTQTAIISVEQGDYFEVRFNTNKSGNTTLSAARCFFQIEVLEALEAV